MKNENFVNLAALGIIAIATAGTLTITLRKSAKNHKKNIEKIRTEGAKDLIAVQKAGERIKKSIDHGNYDGKSFTQLTKDFNVQIAFEKIAIREE